ncbi:patatin-like phospholipase family protein [Paenibacillus eucommiae]|uniref:Patatin/cPLA2 family phospholipase n=1 Tax=Paenibacillus eucommiae TaxID=1355755 RepID=A0ABS4J669_9BACL|nr:patatin family protein [Paenibacillus eucommiae]MBP1995295.1 putative patatin/cPLA2 family phospholipase [Paenibacillus eucommiae]
MRTKENLDGVGLVLEGGGMRGVYTAGVLDYFLDQEWHFPYVVGVSAGALSATSYISRQRGRNKKITIDYVRDARYLSYRNWIWQKSMFGMDFIFNQLPNVLEPFDFQAFYKSPQKFAIGTMDAYTGEPIYFMKHDWLEGIMPILQASSSLPFVAQPVQFQGRTLFDGGLVDPIPINKSLLDGNKRHVIILTKELGYRKTPFKQKWFVQSVYPKFKGLAEVLMNRSVIYNNTLETIERLEKEGKAFVIRPSNALKISRVEKNVSKLQLLYDLGFKDAEREGQRLREWLIENN